MDDRELLERAAKAAGMEIHHWSTILPGPMMVDPVTGECSHYWNPLESDGDALRLAVKLNIGVQSHAFAGDYSLASNGDVSIAELHQGDRYAATRRAIVRAAASLPL